jgi:ribonuclease HII
VKAGIDEVGTGAVAGPVVVAVVVIESGAVEGLRDSKLIAEPKRYELDRLIRRAAPFLWTAQREVDFIDRHGLAKAWLACMQECVHYVMAHFQSIEIMADNPPAKWKLDGLRAVKFMPNGDDTVYEIQAASIVAKAHRDRIMKKLAERNPGYGFEVNKGYATKVHIQALKDKGPSPIHRSSWETAVKTDRKAETAFDRARAVKIINELVPLLENKRLVSDWERDFVSSINVRLQAGDLTKQQMYYLVQAEHKIGKRAKKLGGVKP